MDFNLHVQDNKAIQTTSGLGNISTSNQITSTPPTAPQENSDKSPPISAPPPPPLFPPHQAPGHEGALEKLGLDYHSVPPPPPLTTPIGKPRVENDVPPPIPPKHEGMLKQMRLEHEQPPHPHESVLEGAGWVTPPPPPPLPGLPGKTELVQPPPLAPKPAGILESVEHHDGIPPAERPLGAGPGLSQPKEEHMEEVNGGGERREDVLNKDV
ncbi:hypothetical protein DFH07DRAFT_862770 [Mycena maculata]|uniref:Uncharacterized protein n=1 Tax=Mycena maculata TaxID=230809 RepID=A0AAD7MFX7_9AGAR|nr:hypothetical protein DFH07DRAFT_862770 [Mycena maculata]